MARQGAHFCGVVGQQFYLINTQASQHLNSREVYSFVVIEAQLFICVDCVEPFLLEFVSPQFVDQTNSLALPEQILPRHSTMIASYARLFSSYTTDR